MLSVLARLGDAVSLMQYTAASRGGESLNRTPRYVNVGEDHFLPCSFFGGTLIAETPARPCSFQRNVRLSGRRVFVRDGTHVFSVICV